MSTNYIAHAVAKKGAAKKKAPAEPARTMAVDQDDQFTMLGSEPTMTFSDNKAAITTTDIINESYYLPGAAAPQISRNYPAPSMTSTIQ